MSIKKMLLLASMALAAIALAAPVAAQANVVLTAGGVALKAKAPVTATSKNLVTTVGANSLTCEEVVLHYTVTTNGPNHVVVNPTKAHSAVTKNCVTHVPGVGTFTNNITNAGAGQLAINTWGTGETAATFTTATPALGVHCSYTGKVPVQATNTTTALQLHVETSNSLTAPEPGCATGEMHGSFTVTSGLNPVEIHFVGTP